FWGQLISREGVGVQPRFPPGFSFSNCSKNRNGPDDETKQSDMLLYSANVIATHPDLGFLPNDFIFMVLLSGGDYSVSCTPQGIAKFDTFFGEPEWSARLWNHSCFQAGQG